MFRTWSGFVIIPELEILKIFLIRDLRARNEEIVVVCCVLDSQGMGSQPTIDSSTSEARPYRGWCDFYCVLKQGPVLTKSDLEVVCQKVDFMGLAISGRRLL